MRARSDKSAVVRLHILQALHRLSVANASQRQHQPIPLLDGRALLPTLYAGLKDMDPKVRSGAAKLLAGFDAGGELVLVEALLKDASSTVREAAAMGLSHIGARAFRTLLLGLKDVDVRVRAASASSLLRIDPNALNAYFAKRPVLQTQALSRSISESMNLLLASSHAGPLALTSSTTMSSHGFDLSSCHQHSQSQAPKSMTPLDQMTAAFPSQLRSSVNKKVFDVASSVSLNFASANSLFVQLQQRLMIILQSLPA